MLLEPCTTFPSPLGLRLPSCCWPPVDHKVIFANIRSYWGKVLHVLLCFKSAVSNSIKCLLLPSNSSCYNKFFCSVFKWLHVVYWVGLEGSKLPRWTALFLNAPEALWCLYDMDMFLTDCKWQQAETARRKLKERKKWAQSGIFSAWGNCERLQVEAFCVQTRRFINVSHFTPTVRQSKVFWCRHVFQTRRFPGNKASFFIRAKAEWREVGTTLTADLLPSHHPLRLARENWVTTFLKC